jgi:hypothetical protein
VTIASYQIAALISLFILGLASLFLGESAYRQAQLFWFDPATGLGQRTKLIGRGAQAIGVFLMLIGAIFLFSAIVSFFFLPFFGLAPTNYPPVQGAGN